MPPAIIVPAGLIGGPYQIVGATTGGGGGGFTPASLTGLIGWYKSDAGVYVDAGSTLAANGQTVQQWNDQSGTGNHLTQAASGNRPVYTTGLLNGLPGLVFVDINSQWLAQQAIALGGKTASVFMVVKTPPTAGSADRFASFTATGTSDDFSAGPSAVFLYQSSATNVSAYRNGGMSNGTIVANTFMQLGSIYDTLQNTVYISGAAQSPVNNGDTFAATGAFTLGAYTASPPGSVTGSNFLTGTICEVVLANTALGSTDRASLNSYFTSKWGV